jgi:two-component system, response regulator
MNASFILLVEDNPRDAELTQRALKKSNVLNPIVHVSDGAEALDFLFCRGAWVDRAATEMPQLILLDLKLPKLDGLEVLSALRGDERTKLLPVVMLTSSAEDQDVIRSYGLGANSFVRKPVDFAQFVEAARILGLFWLVVNRPPPSVSG